MAITDIDISETLEAGAPSITYKGDQRPQQVASASDPMDDKNQISLSVFGKPLHELTPDELLDLDEYMQDKAQKWGGAYGGIAGVRQPYGFGSFVKKALKKVTRPLKKIAKSPLGKAALLYGATAGLGNIMQPGAAKWANMKWLAPATVKGNLLGYNALQQAQRGLPHLAAQKGLLGKLNLTGGYGKLMPTALGWGTAAAAAPFLAPGLSGPVDETIEGFATGDQDFDFDYAQMRKDIGDAVAGGDYTEFTEVLDKYNLTEGQQVPYWDTLAAEGGRIGYAEGSPHSDPKVFASQLRSSNTTPAMSALFKDQNFMETLINQLRAAGKTPEQIVRELQNLFLGTSPEKTGIMNTDIISELKPIAEPFYPDSFEGKEIREPFNPNDPQWENLKPELYAQGGRIGYDEGGSGKTYEKWLDYRIKTIAKGRLPIPFKEWKKGEIKMAHGGSTNFRGADSNEMLNLGGLEKDYRFDGGFVPIGEYEKKDDVPARLSKNEFVFTADAVRAAGGGNVNKGAQRMYDTMKKLESRVA